MIFYRATVCIAILSLLATVRSQAFADTPENQQSLNQKQQNEARQESLARKVNPYFHLPVINLKRG